MRSDNGRKKYRPRRNVLNQYSTEQMPKQSRPQLVGSTRYFALTNNDLMYFGNFNRLIMTEFKLVLDKMLRDFRILLHMNYNDFWDQIRTSPSLRHSLESCLQIFPRKISKQLIQVNTTDDSAQHLLNNEEYYKWDLLMHTVLVIYHRIACESEPEEKQVIYDEWILDVPKMINMLDIYAESHTGAVKEILRAMFEEVESYEDDISEFIKLLNEKALQQLERDLGYVYTQQRMKKSKNFMDPRKSFTTNLMKCFYFINETYNAITQYLKFFPQRYCEMLISERYLHITLLNGYFVYIENISGLWEIEPKVKVKLRLQIEQTRQIIIQYIIVAFDTIFSIVFGDMHGSFVWKVSLNLYVHICNDFLARKRNGRQEQWDSLLIILMNEMVDRPVFLYQQDVMGNLSEQDQMAVKQCQEWERRLRRGNQPMDMFKQDLIMMMIEQLPCIQEWNSLNMDRMGEQEDFDEFREIKEVKEVQDRRPDQELSAQELVQRVNKARNKIRSKHQYKDESQNLDEGKSLDFWTPTEIDLSMEEDEVKVSLTEEELNLSFKISQDQVRDQSPQYFMKDDLGSISNNDELSFSNLSLQDEILEQLSEKKTVQQTNNASSKVSESFNLSFSIVEPADKSDKKTADDKNNTSKMKKKQKKVCDSSTNSKKSLKVDKKKDKSSSNALGSSIGQISSISIEKVESEDDEDDFMDMFNRSKNASMLKSGGGKR